MRFLLMVVSLFLYPLLVNYYKNMESLQWVAFLQQGRERGSVDAMVKFPLIYNARKHQFRKLKIASFLIIIFSKPLQLNNTSHSKMQDWFLPQFDTLIPIIAGIMLQDLTVLHSAKATREKQGKKWKYENIKIKTHININTHLEEK